MPIDVDVQQLKPLKNFGDGCPGCGSLLGLKLLLQSLDNIILVNATGSMTPFIKVGVPVIHAGLNASAVARGVAHSLEEKNRPTVVVFAGDGATSLHLNSLLNSKEDIIYVCANDQGYTAMNYKLEKGFAKQLAHTAAYSATGCVSYPQDYITKLKKASTISGFKFIDLLCPCPSSWIYEPSNTMEVGRVAVETGIWPLFEIEKGSLTLTKRPNRLEPVEHFAQVQKKFALANQEEVNRNWKIMTDGRVI